MLVSLLPGGSGELTFHAGDVGRGVEHRGVLERKIVFGHDALFEGRQIVEVIGVALRNLAAASSHTEDGCCSEDDR